MHYQASCAGQLFRKSLARSFLELNAPVSIDLENVNLEDVSSCSHSSTGSINLEDVSSCSRSSTAVQPYCMQQIAHLSRHWALELAKKRLGLAVIASASGQVCTIAALSADIIELVGAHITRGTAIHSLVARHQYWPTCKPPPTKRHRS